MTVIVFTPLSGKNENYRCSTKVDVFGIIFMVLLLLMMACNRAVMSTAFSLTLFNWNGLVSLVQRGHLLIRLWLTKLGHETYHVLFL